MKYIFFLLIFSTMLFAFAKNEINCKDIYKKAWISYYQNDLVHAQDIIDECTVYDDVTQDWINVVQAMIYIQAQENKKALEVLKNTRQRVMEAFNNRNKQLRKNESKHDIKALYLNMLSNTGYANALLGNYKEALKNLYLSLKEERNNTYVLEYIGMCYYKLENYKKAVKFLKQAYAIRQLSDKPTIAFSIASVYAMAEDINNSIKWLREPLNKNHIFYKKKIEEETDFDKIRNNPKFLNYLSR